MTDRAIKNEIKSPLRYPGGKSRACSRIHALRPETFDEFREPFVGGGSVFLYMQQRYTHIKFWINDLNPEVHCFWETAKKDSEGLAWEASIIKATTDDGRLLYEEMRDVDVLSLTTWERAVRFFVLNRITFSGVAESGGYSAQSFANRFTTSALNRLARLGKALENVEVTCLDYSKLMADGGENVFTFLDPPYMTTAASKLYGQRGVLHVEFDHARCAETVKQCKHNVLITYDDTPEILELYKDFNTQKWELQYGMNNVNGTTAKKGAEVFIANYTLDERSE